MGNSQSSQCLYKNFKITNRSIKLAEDTLWSVDFAGWELKQYCEISHEYFEDVVDINNIDELLKKNDSVGRKIQKILRSNGIAITLHLDDYVNYENGSYKHIKVANETPFSDYKTGDCLEINLTKASKISSDWVINSSAQSILIADTVGIIGITERAKGGNILKETVEYVNEIVETRKRYAAASEWGRSTNNPLWKPTSWDMPPK